MKLSLLQLLLPSSLLLSTASAVLHIPFERRIDDVVTPPGEASLSNPENVYFAVLRLGSDKTHAYVRIDTGSSDLWVPSSDASPCQNGGCEKSSFDLSSSNSSKVIGEGEFNITYDNGDHASGDYVSDDIVFGACLLHDFTFAVANDTNAQSGVLGIGYPSNEVNVSQNGGKQYANLPQALVDANYTSSPAYSMWLYKRYLSGSILFGAIDKSKYTGDLISIPILPKDSGSDRRVDFNVALTSVAVSSASGNDTLTPSGYAQPVVLDSGTNLTVLPNDIAALVFEEFGAEYNTETQDAFVPCRLKDSNATITFGFAGAGGPNISVSMSDLVFPHDPNDSPQAVQTMTDGSRACYFGIAGTSDPRPRFGTTFMRSAYVVYDLANDMIALAQSERNETGDTDYVEFASKGAAIPSASKAAATQSIDSNEMAGDYSASIPSVAPTPSGLAAASAIAEDEGAAGSLKPLKWEIAALVGGWTIVMALGGGMLVWS